MLSIAQLKLCMLALRLDRDTSETKLAGPPEGSKDRSFRGRARPCV